MEGKQDADLLGGCCSDPAPIQPGNGVATLRAHRFSGLEDEALFSSSPPPFPPLLFFYNRLGRPLLSSREAGVGVVDFEMILYDTHPSCLGGLSGELIYSDQVVPYCATE